MRLRFWFGSALAAVLLVLGVQGVAQAIARPVVGNSLEYTAAEYFDGVYFGVGPVAELVPQLHVPRLPGGDAEAAELAAELRAHIEAETPRFLDTFAAAMVSGDHVVVRDALADGVDRLVAAQQAVSGGETAQSGVTPEHLTYVMDNGIALWESGSWIIAAVAHEEMQRLGSTDLHMDEAAGVIATELAGR